TVFCVFANLGIKDEMLSQGASKVNISFVLMEEQLVDEVVNLHKCFFEGVCALGERDESNCPVKENLEDIGE
ncbi:MAG: ACT domain-containing protein, partial [bacterium]